MAMYTELSLIGCWLRAVDWATQTAALGPQSPEAALCMLGCVEWTVIVHCAGLTWLEV